MAWVKSIISGSDVYALSFKQTKLHYIKDVSLEQLNDTSGPSTFRLEEDNPAYVKELFPHLSTVEFLPKGVYKLRAPHQYADPKLYKIIASSKTRLFKLESVDIVLEDFNSFVRERDLYKKLEMGYKRGVLLYGPPGTGKTSAINMIIDSIQDLECVVVYVSGELPNDFIVELGKDPRLKILIFEELTETLKSLETGDFLTFLDGETSWDNLYVIATTNYPENLPGNIVNRPGRFDKLIPLTDISDRDRRTFLEHYLDVSVSDEDLLLTKRYSLSFLKELVLIILKNRISFLEAVKLVQNHQEIVATAFKTPTDDEDLGNGKYIL